MKMKFFRTLVVGAGLFAASVTMAQSSNVVNAALEYKDYEAGKVQGKVADAKSALLEAKGYIDQAIVHADTEKDGKANWYYGMIYTELVQFAAMTQDADLLPFATEENQQKAFDALKFAINDPNAKSKTTRGAEDYVKIKMAELNNAGYALYNAKNFAGAMAAFGGSYEFSGLLGEKDADLLQNAMNSGYRAMDTLVKVEKYDEALTIADAALELDPQYLTISGLAIEVALKKDDMELATKYFDKAAAAAPDNKELFGSVGSIFLGKGEVAKAEELLKKAVALDSNYSDANYNLGVLYLEEGKRLQREVSDMSIDDPNLSAAENNMRETFAKAITPLENYMRIEGESAQVVKVLMQVSKQAGQTEKALAYKKRLDALMAQ